MEAVKKEISKPAILPDKFGLAEHKRHDWVADVEPTRTLDEILEPGYWAHIAAQMESLDRIEVRWEDGSRIVHLRVRFCEHNYAKVKVVAVEELGTITAETTVSASYSVQWKGHVMKFAVIRHSDKAVIQQGFKERSQASAWLVEHERA